MTFARAPYEALSLSFAKHLSALWQHAEEKEILFSFLMDSKHDSALCQRVLPSEFYIYRWGEQGQPYYRRHALTAGITSTPPIKNRYIQKTICSIAKKLLIDGARQRARKAGLEFSLSLEWLETQDLTRCPISKRPFTWKKRQNTEQLLQAEHT